MTKLGYQNPATQDSQLDSKLVDTGSSTGSPETRQEFVRVGEDDVVGRDDIQLQILDELRAIRLGIQTLLVYLNPLSGVSAENSASGVLLPIARMAEGSQEPNIFEWAQTIRSEIGKDGDVI